MKEIQKIMIWMINLINSMIKMKNKLYKYHNKLKKENFNQK